MAFPTKRERAFRARLLEAERVIELARFRMACTCFFPASAYAAQNALHDAIAAYDKNPNQVKP
jgi:hypothetical protein